MNNFIYFKDRLSLNIKPEDKVVVVRKGISKKDELYDLFSQELKFPLFFGRNWDALYDCLSDLSWLPEYRVLIIHEDVPFKEQDLERSLYIDLISDLEINWHDRNIHKLDIAFHANCQKEIAQLLSKTEAGNLAGELASEDELIKYERPYCLNETSEDPSDTKTAAKCNNTKLITLFEVVKNLDSFDEESTIYLEEPWTENSKAIVTLEPDTGGLPKKVKEEELRYFLEIFIAREFLEEWIASLDITPTLHQKCERLIQYAAFDA